MISDSWSACAGRLAGSGEGTGTTTGADLEPSVADLWGERTPYDRSGEWPARVDSHLQAGVPEDEVERWVQSASVLDSNGDALDIAVRQGRIVGVRGRVADRVTQTLIAAL